jgi:hypothetical protein
MQDPNTTSRQRWRRSDAAGDRARRHDQAVIEAEVRDLTRAIRPYGVLRHDALAHVAGAARWPGNFDRALQVAVEEGRLDARPLGFYAYPRHLGDDRYEIAEHPSRLESP